MNKVLLWVVKLIILLPLLFLCSINWKAYYRPPCTIIAENKVNTSVLAQLRYLDTKRQQGAAEAMQDIYPEGFLFFHAIYGLTWVELLQHLKPESSIYQEGLTALNQSLEAIFSPQCQNLFPEDLPLPHGAFYMGWSTYLLGQKLRLNPESEDDTIGINIFKERCQTIAQAFDTSGSSYLPSYHQGIWPADNILCLAALNLHDQFLEDSFGKTRANCLKAIKKQLDPITGLIPHSIHENTGSVARGSSQALMLNFLPEIDSSFAKAQFDLFKEQFVAYRMGLPGIREYPHGTSGAGDIDSGPVIWGIGGAASIVGSKTMSIYGEWELYQALRNSVAGFGLSFEFANRRTYLLGALPIADVFIAWANAGVCQVPHSASITIKWAFHLYTLIIIFVLGLLAYKL